MEFENSELSLGRKKTTPNAKLVSEINQLSKEQKLINLGQTR